MGYAHFSRPIFILCALSYGFPMVFLRLPTFSFGFPMVFPWFSYDFMCSWSITFSFAKDTGRLGKDAAELLTKTCSRARSKQTVEHEAIVNTILYIYIISYQSMIGMNRIK